MVIVTYVEIENGDDHGGSTVIGDNYQSGQARTMVLVIVIYCNILIAIGNNVDDQKQ